MTPPHTTERRPHRGGGHIEAPLPPAPGRHRGLPAPTGFEGEGNV